MEDISLHILDIVENSIVAKAKNVEINMERDGGFLKLTIRDDGVGMDGYAVRKSMDPFFSTKSKKTGLGIPLLAQACRETGGNLTVESEQGKGTQITAELNMNHIDCKTLGDIEATLKVLRMAHPDINFIYKGKL